MKPKNQRAAVFLHPNASLSFMAIVFAAALMPPSPALSENHYVDASGGSDENTGLSPVSAWRTLGKVNVSVFQPGDSILFKRGETFRGTLRPAGGSASGPIVYGAYGSGDRPRLLGSYRRSSAGDWIHEGGNIWRTSHRTINASGPELLPNPDFSSDLSNWSLWSDAAGGTSAGFSRTTAAGEYHTAPGGGKLACTRHGNVMSDLQLITANWTVRELRWYCLSFRAKASPPFSFPPDGITFHRQSSPWTNYSFTSSPRLSITADWTDHTVYYKANTTSNECRITFFLGGIIPEGGIFYIDSVSLRECDADPELLDVDVGNLIFDNEASCGVKVWEKPDLDAQGEFWYDEDNDLLVAYSVSNPGDFHSEIELSMNWDLINVSNKSHVVCENLDLRYGANGVWGILADHICIKDCAFSFMGGADQTGGTGIVRMGNGVTFWNGSHDNTVERCTFDQIYDAAISPQGFDDIGFEVYNLHFRNNVIRRCEYSFEYWERYESTRAHDIYFENNTCMDAGGGWSHSQRPDPNGAHLMLYSNPAQTENVYIRNNIFFNSVDYGVRWQRTEDVGKVIMDRNCWYESSGPIAWVGNTFYDFASEWEDYQTATHQDSRSIHQNPLLNPDFTLKEDSPCIDAGAVLSAVTDDFNGTARPQGGGHDIGAFEAAAPPLSTPVPVAPADGVDAASINPKLSWNAVPGAALYHLRVSTSETYAPADVDDSTLTQTSRQIGPLQHNTEYWWKVRAKKEGGHSRFSSSWRFTTEPLSPVEQAGTGIPKNYGLEQNHPNPFNPVTTIRYRLPRTGRVRIRVFDVKGREVAVLVDGVEGPGIRSVRFNGSGLAGGVYTCRMHAGDFESAKKLLLLK